MITGVFKGKLSTKENDENNINSHSDRVTWVPAGPLSENRKMESITCPNIYSTCFSKVERKNF